MAVLLSDRRGEGRIPQCAGPRAGTVHRLFIQKSNLPPISSEVKRGGVCVLGWSSGNGLAAAALANAHRLPAEGQKRFADYIRAYVMQEHPSIFFGLPLSPTLWSPHMDGSIPEDWQTPFYTRWITSYFDHGELASRNVHVLSYIVPGTTRAPSIYNTSVEELSEMIDEGPQELAGMFTTQAQANAIYRKSLLHEGVRATMPRLKVSLLTGDATCSFSLNALWSIHDDDEKNGGGFVRFSIIPGVNHFMHWDEPEKDFNAYMDASLL